MALPAHVDMQLLGSIMVMMGFDDNAITRQLDRAGASPQVVWDNIRGMDLPDRQERAVESAERYMTSLSGGDLRAFLVEGLNMPESVVTKAISQSKSTDTIADVITRIGKDDTQYVNKASTRQKVADILGRTNTLGLTGLNKSKQQYMTPTLTPQNQDTSSSLGIAGRAATPKGGKPKGPVKMQTLPGENVGGSIWKTLDQKLSVPGAGDGAFLDELAKDPGAGGPGAGGPGAPDYRPVWQKEGRKPTPEEFDSYVKKHFGFNAWFTDVPEVRTVLFNATAEGLTDVAEITRRVEATAWWKNTQGAARSWHAFERSAAPADVADRIGDQERFLNDMATSMGINVDPARMREMAETSLRFGWDSSEVKRALGNEFQYDPNAQQQAPDVSAVKEKAAKWLVPLSDQAIGDWAKGIMTGDYSEEELDEYMKGYAKSMFPQLTAAIDAGHTVAQYIDPYKQLAAQTLEVPLESINFMDTKWRRALEQKDPKTGQIGVMTLSEWSSLLKTDKTYGYDSTNAAVQESSDLATKILQKFGKVA